MSHADSALVTVEEAAQLLGVSVSTIRRRIRSGALPSVRQRAQRMVPATALTEAALVAEIDRLPPFTRDNPIFRLMGAGRSGGHGPGARDKHAILDR